MPGITQYLYIMQEKIVKDHDGREIRIFPTCDRVDYDDGPGDTHPDLAAYFAKQCQQAIDLLGHHDMQHIRVSCEAMGMGAAIASGNYIDIYHSPRVFNAIKEELLARKQQWEEIAGK